MGTYLLITPKKDELYHFGIKGMKWGIRRFQPYQAGEQVKGGKEVGAATKVKQRPSSGNIIERYKAHKTKQKRVAALKKAREKRKADADFEEAKKKAIESGTIEDLAKFKGKLSNEEYNRAFSRLQNEKKVADMVAANQKTVWDKIDKGMAIVQKVGGYANTLATAKENFTKLDDALHKKEKEEAKEKATAEKNKFITNIENITELNRGMDKYKLTPQEYQSAMNILRNKKLARGKDDDIDEDFVDQDRKTEEKREARRESREEFANKARSTAEAAADKAKSAASSARDKYLDFEKNRIESGRRTIESRQFREQYSGYKAPSSNDGSSTKAKAPTSSYADRMAATQERYRSHEAKPVSEYEQRMRNVKATYSSKKQIYGYNTKAQGSYTARKPGQLSFGDSTVSYKRSGYKPSQTVTDARKAVQQTQAKAAYERETAEKKRQQAASSKKRRWW